jgi:hypothetical protein
MNNTQELPDLYDSFLKRHDIGTGDIVIARGKEILKTKLDFDVYLPSKKMNLQRDFVWTLEQKHSLIDSIIVRRHIPPISVLLTYDDIYQVIDGKQRLGTFIDYLSGKFKYCGYYYQNLPKRYCLQIDRYNVFAYRLCEDDITDEQKIEWFKWINFAGTPQDLEHLNKLK